MRNLLNGQKTFSKILHILLRTSEHLEKSVNLVRKLQYVAEEQSLMLALRLLSQVINKVIIK